MENIDTKQTNPISEQSVNSNSNAPQTQSPDNPQQKKFKIIFIGFFIIFFLTLGAAAAIYIFKEASRSSNNADQIPSTSPQSTIEFEVSPMPTNSTADTKCVVAGCSGQLCVSKQDADGLITTCEYTESYACYKTATCELQQNGKCGWTMTPELISCLDSAQ